MSFISYDIEVLEDSEYKYSQRFLFIQHSLFGVSSEISSWWESGYAFSMEILRRQYRVVGNTVSFSG